MRESVLASLTVRSPAATDAMIEAIADDASAAVRISGSLKPGVGVSRRGGQMRSMTSFSATVSPPSAASITDLVIVSAWSSINACAASVALWRAPFRPTGVFGDPSPLGVAA